MVYVTYFYVHNGSDLVTKLYLTLETQASLPMGFSRQEYWSGLPSPSPRDPSDPGIKAGSPALQADTSLNEPPRKPCI